MLMKRLKCLIVFLCFFPYLIWAQEANHIQADTTKKLQENTYQNLLDSLTQTIKKYGLEKQIMQKSLQEAETQKNLSLWGFIGAGISVLIVVFLIIRNVRQKDLLIEQQQTIEEQNHELQAQTEELRQQQEEIAAQRDDIIQKNKVLAEKNKLIQESIQVASLIQKALLAKTTNLQDYFRGFAILSKPKDIVSGDFYWVGRVQHTTIVVLVDSMGHGVPAAFISLTINMLLKEIVLIRKQISPDIILEELNNNLRQIIHHNGENSHNISADIAICSIQKTIGDSFCIDFAGARRPMLYVLNNEIMRFRGNRVSVSSDTTWEEHFENETIELSSKTRIFIFSDGLTDQNNKEGKKFGENQLIQILQKGISESIQNQIQNVERALLEHQGGCPQRDDILMVAIEL